MILDFNGAPLQDPLSGPVPEWTVLSAEDVHASLCRSLEGVLGYLYPQGFADPRARKFYIGSVQGEAGESLCVELQGPKAGLWHDFATGDGGDIFDLWQAARGLSSFREALSDAAEYSGATANTPRRTPKRQSPKGGEAWGSPTHTYRYLDASGSIIAEVDRFEWTSKDGQRRKTFRPWDVATRSYRAPETRPLYNLPGIVSAPEIILVEGEKAADALIGQGIDATTAMGGANAPLEKTDWSPLRGRKVVIWPDNDATGRAYAERLKLHLEEQGVLAVSILRVSAARPEGWDAADAFEAGEDLGALLRNMRSVADTLQMESRFFSAADFDGHVVPTRQWHVEGLIPARQVTMLGGDGGVGKSLLALQLSIASATNGLWVGLRPAACQTLYLSAEDDRDEIHRRVDAITAGLGIPMSGLQGLTLRSLAGEDALLATVESRSGTLQPTPLFHELDTYIADTRTGFLTLDTLADLHSGQENDRTVARQFIGLLRGLALRRECTILLLAHPSLTGMSSGSGLSGSTAWNNSVRSRLYFERIVEEKQEPDPDLRRLSNKKANYGRTGGDLLVRWSDGMFVPEGGGGGSVLDAMASSAKARRVFLELLDQYTIEGRNVNARAGMNYAPSAFAKDPRNERVSRAAFVQAMGDLFRSGAIRNESYGPPSRGTTRIVRAS